MLDDDTITHYADESCESIEDQRVAMTVVRLLTGLPEISL